MNCELEKWFRSKKVLDQQSTPSPGQTDLYQSSKEAMVRIKTEYNNKRYLRWIGWIEY